MAGSFAGVRAITLGTAGCGRSCPEVKGIVDEELKRSSARAMQLRGDFENS